MNEKFIDYYMGIADLTSKLSYAQRLKVGSVIVKNNQIIGSGYNGTPAGWDNECEYKYYKIDGWLVDDEGCYELRTKPEVIHSESNAILKVAKSTESTDGAIMFCTHAPCLECAKLIHQSGIKQLYYREQYRSNAGLEFLEKSGVSITHYEK